MPDQTRPDLNPTDQKILTLLADGRRQNRTNIAHILDRDPNYITNRITELQSKGVVSRVGPAERSTLIEITPEGRAAIHEADRPEPTVRARYPPSKVQTSPHATRILEAISERGYPLEQLAEQTGESAPYLKYLLTGLAYQDLVDDHTAIISMEIQDSDIEKTEETKSVWKATDRGERFLEKLERQSTEDVNLDYKGDSDDEINVQEYVKTHADIEVPFSN